MSSSRWAIKEFAPKTARRFAAQVAPTEWESIDLFTHVCGPQPISKRRWSKALNNGLSLTNLRTRSYRPIENFLQVVALTFNLLSWFRHYFLAPLQLQDLGLCEITQKLMDIPAKCSYHDDHMILRFPANHPFTPALAGF